MLVASTLREKRQRGEYVKYTRHVPLKVGRHWRDKLRDKSLRLETESIQASKTSYVKCSADSALFSWKGQKDGQEEERS